MLLKDADRCLKQIGAMANANVPEGERVKQGRRSPLNKYIQP